MGKINLKEADGPAGIVLHESLLSRIGLPPAIVWGYLGLLLFMVGDGVESGYLAPFLMSRGYAANHVAWVFAAYGLMAGLAGWLSGSLSDAWGPRRVILCGFVIWLGCEVAFLLFGLPHGFLAILLTYGFRGLGYPLFAFGFLVWITVAAPANRLASAMGWFWFAFTGGLPTLGSLVAGWAVPRVGQVNTLWIGASFVAVGGLVLLLGVREPRGMKRLVPEGISPFTVLWHSISLIWRNPKTGIACVVRLINTTPEFGFLVFLPGFFMHTIGFSLVRWLHLLSVIFVSNIIWNLLFGLIADRVGWIRTISVFGGVGCFLSTLAMYYVPIWHHGYAATLVAGACYGAALAGYVPLSALMPVLSPEERGASLSLLSLGAGASVSLGPALVALFLRRLDVRGVIWIFAALYLLSALLILRARPPRGQQVESA